ncbi:MAG: protease modulator HflC [Phenylobacterium sp.]
MTRTPFIAWAILAVAVLILLANTLFIVEQREEAIVLQLGQPVRVIHAPNDSSGAGLNFKIPFMQHVVKLDRRNIAMEADQEEVIDGNEQRLVIDAFLRYRISDPLQFFRTLHDERTANDRLERLVNSSLRQVVGSTTTDDIVSGRRDELMQQSKLDVERRAKASRLGIDVIDLRIKRVDFPAANRASVYRRMQTQRQQEAAQYRAQGEQQKREIIASADKEVTITLAQAQEQGETVRGQGDAQRTRIFAQSFGRDPSFARFYRQLQVYEQAMTSGDTTLVLTPDAFPGLMGTFGNGPSGKR